MTAAIWQKNYTRCIEEATVSGKMDHESVKSFCSCAATELVYKPSCEQVEKYNHDAEFQKKINGRIQQACPVLKLKGVTSRQGK